jgi:hypothetical protein
VNVDGVAVHSDPRQIQEKRDPHPKLGQFYSEASASRRAGRLQRSHPENTFSYRPQFDLERAVAHINAHEYINSSQQIWSQQTKAPSGLTSKKSLKQTCGTMVVLPE